jgi:hypothetical protein
MTNGTENTAVGFEAMQNADTASDKDRCARLRRCPIQ